MTISFLRSVHATNMHDACKGALGTGIRAFQHEPYGDLDGDGREEAAVTAFSCLAGNGGPDLIAVFTLTANGKVEESADSQLAQSATEPSQRGAIQASACEAHQMTVGHREWPLIKSSPSSWESTPLRASGGTREFIYRWKSDKLVLDDVVDVATNLPSMRPSGPSRAIRAVDVKKLLDDNTFGFVP